MAEAAYTDTERSAWQACMSYFRDEIERQAVLRAPNKLATRRGIYSESTLYVEGCHLRALYVLYGLCRGRPWSGVESTHDERVPALRPYIVFQWNKLVKAGHIAPVPETIADWL